MEEIKHNERGTKMTSLQELYQEIAEDWGNNGHEDLTDTTKRMIRDYIGLAIYMLGLHQAESTEMKLALATEQIEMLSDSYFNEYNAQSIAMYALKEITNERD